MELIIPHINADFDALASAVAAHYLYPAAKLFFPGSQERNVRAFVAAHGQVLPDIIKAKDLAGKSIKRLILVDVSHPNRLGEFKYLLDGQDVEIIRFDHHPGKEEIKNHFMQKQAGANISLMIALLQRKKIRVDWETSTLFALGIYEETGQLSYSTTEAVDFEALAWCRRQGADLSMVMEYLKQSFNQDQQALFEELIRSRATVMVNGYPVSIAQTKRDFFVEDLAVMASKLKEIENLAVLIVLCQMGNRTYMVVRSSNYDVAANKVAALFGGGGGHATAASTVIKGRSLEELREELLSNLNRLVQPGIKAKEFMSRPVMTVQRTATVAEVKQAMTRFGHTGLPVIWKNQLVGIVTLHDLDRSIKHGFSDSTIEHHMTTQLITAAPDTPMEEIQKLFFKHNINHVPVVEQKHVKGMITRSDLLKVMIEKRNALGGAAHPNDTYRYFQIDHGQVKHLMLERVPQSLLNLLHTAGAVADQLGVKAFVVGGFVRDLLMNIENWDIDIVIEGDGLLFARRFARKIGGHVKTHERFRTAIIKLPHHQKIDIATARTEYYEKPAALPRVEQATIKYDLYRRDFSINTLAVQLNLETFGALIDHFNGVHDLKEGIIRVLYAVSFVDDPTRLFRAVRFEQRLNFTIEPDTLLYMKHAIKINLVQKLSMPRIADELLLILDEEQPEKAIRRLNELGVLRWIHKKIPAVEIVMTNFKAVWEALAFAILYLEEKIDNRIMYLMALFDQLTAEEVAEFAQQAQFSKKIKTLLRIQKQQGSYARKRIEKMTDYQKEKVVNLLKDLPLEVLLYNMAQARTKQAIRLFRNYVTKWRHIQPMITGTDLKKMGYPPGPLFEKILTKLRNGHLNETIKTKRDELRCLQRFYPVSHFRDHD